MSAQILDGRKVRDSLIPVLTESVKGLTTKTLTIIQVGQVADSSSYIRAKKAFAEKIGLTVNHVELPEDVSQAKVVEVIEENNEDSSVRGIIVQLPLPLSLDRDEIIDTIDPDKDVDALTSYRVKRWFEGEEDALLPATARGIRTLLDYYKIDLFGKKVVIVGRSMLVGKPIVAMCLGRNATVTVCHSKTPELMAETQSAHVIIVAAGKPGLIGKDHVRAGQIVIDVGINTSTGEKLDDEIPEKKLIGDVDFEAVSPIVAYITPVPGGVGPMTVVSLYQNLLELSREE